MEKQQRAAMAGGGGGECLQISKAGVVVAHFLLHGELLVANLPGARMGSVCQLSPQRRGRQLLLEGFRGIPGSKAGAGKELGRA